MKKILTFLSGIVFLITILVAGGCGSATQTPAKGPKEVNIYLKAVKKDQKKHLKMSDSNKPDIVVVDTLETLVYPGDTVVWEPRKYFSRIDKIEKIGPVTPDKGFIKDAQIMPGTKNLMLIISEDAPNPSESEKYYIQFMDKHGNSWTIDPYLRIPPH